MRLIDADALKDFTYINKGNFNTVEGIREWIDNAPTIIRCGRTSDGLPLFDLTPRPRGKWKIDGSLIACDQCGRILLKASELYNFCPQCGAQMKGGADLQGGET